MPSAEFQAFAAALAAPARLQRDDIDGNTGIRLLYLLTGPERQEAEDLLIGKLADDDYRLPGVLAENGCARAIPALAERAANSESVGMRVSCADALRRLGDDSGRSALVGVLRSGAGEWYDRGSAVTALIDYPDPDLDVVWQVALSDPDRTTRNTALQALIAAHGLAAHCHSWQDRLGLLCGLLQSPLRSVRAGAEADLRAILARAAAGETPAELGVTWRAEELGVTWEIDGPTLIRGFLSRMDSAAGTPDGNPLPELTGPARRWVEDLVLGMLHRGPWAAEAAHRLGVGRAVEPLRELIDISAVDPANADARAAAAAALRNLTA